MYTCTVTLHEADETQIERFSSWPALSCSTLTRSPARNNITRAIGLHNIKFILSLPSMQEPTDIFLLKPLAIIIKCFPIARVLGNAYVRLSRIVVGLAPSPRTLRDHGRQLDMIQNPLRSLLNVCPGLALGIIAMIEGHGMDVGVVRVAFNAAAQIGQTIAVAEGTRTVPVLADARLDVVLIHPLAECPEVIDEVARVHAVANWFRAPVSAVDDVRCYGREFTFGEGVVNGLLRLLPNILIAYQPPESQLGVDNSRTRVIIKGYSRRTPSPKFVQTCKIRAMLFLAAARIAFSNTPGWVHVG